MEASYRRLLLELALAICAAVTVVGCSRHEGQGNDAQDVSSPEPDVSSPEPDEPDVNQEAPGAEEQQENRDHPPYDACLRRLGAPEGGAWEGRFDGGRILMWLSSDEDYGPPDYAAYVSVIRKERTHAFLIGSLWVVDQIRDENNFLVTLVPIGRGVDGSVQPLGGSKIYVGGIVCGNVIRMDFVWDDEDGVFPPPSEMELHRCVPKAEEQRVRKTLEASIG